MTQVLPVLAPEYTVEVLAGKPSQQLMPCVKYYDHPNASLRKQLGAMQGVRWVRKNDMRIWSAAQVLEIDSEMNSCVRKNTERIGAFVEETNKIRKTADIMIKRLDGETSADTIDAAVELLKMQLAIGNEVRTRLDTDIINARPKSLKALAALNKLGPELVKSTNSITTKIRELEERRQRAAVLFMASHGVMERSRL